MGNPRNLVEAERTLPAHNFKNKIINGGFDIWQRGESKTITVQQYVADRWEFTRGGADLTISKNARNTSVTNPYQCQISATSGSVNHVMRQKIEDCRGLEDGIDVTISFETRYEAGVATSGNTVKIYRVFDDGVTANQLLGSYTFDITLTRTKHEYSFTPASFPIDPSTVGANSHILVEFTFIGGVTQNMVIGDIQLEQSKKASFFERRPIGVELSLCQRYYQSFIGIYIGLYIASSTTTNKRYYMARPVEMRISPTESGTASSGTINLVGTAKTIGMYIDATLSSEVNVQDYTADAEL